MVGLRDGTRIDVPGWPVQPIDATGAGDAFDAAFLVEWTSGVPLDQAGRFANAVGALTTLGLGAVAPIPRRPHVDAFMRMQAGSRQS
jgi:2-dehydro-3-deoxygluconokinase